MTAISSTDIAFPQTESPRPKLDHKMGIRTILIFLAIMALGLFFAAYNIYEDISAAGTTVTSILPFLLLGVALLIALGFEFVNGFHGVSFAHGSNDGQKGMGLIMLILIGTVPTAYALNRTPSAGDVPSFVRTRWPPGYRGQLTLCASWCALGCV
jgi:hypothetical protein